MAERRTKVVLTAQVQGYLDGMEKAAKATRETGSEAEKLAQKREAFETLGRGALIAGGAIAAGLLLSTKAAIDWETAWAGVTKTVDGSDEEMAALEGQLRSLTSVLPATHAEIAAVAEAAGQLGIERENVAAFTRTMIDLGETTNLSAEEAATSLARFTNIMGTSQTEVSNLGSALVDLGNNYATTEGEILAMSMRLAGAGKQIGMTEGDVLGLSAALSSVGIESEAGGSAMSKVMIDIASSVDKSGERLDMFAKVAGVSADSFAQKWKTEPGAALAMFVEGLANAEAQGTSTLGILEEMGITETRMRDALLRSASASDQFTLAMNQGNDAYAENNALTAEAEQRYATTASQLSIMKNNFVDTAISIGGTFLPAIEGGAKAAGSLADFIGDLPEPIIAAVSWIGAIGAAALISGGLMLGAVPKVAAFKTALETLGWTARGLRGLAGALGLVTLGVAAASWGVHEFNKMIQSGVPTQAELTNAILTTADAADALAKAGERSSASQVFMGDTSKELEDLGGVLDRTAGRANNFFSHVFFGMQNRDIGSLDALEDMGEALADIASYDLKHVQQTFMGIAESQKLTREESEELLNRMGPLKDALVEQANVLGINVEGANLMKFALGEIGPASEKSADGAKTAAEAYVEQADAAKAAADELYGLLDALMEANSVGQSAEAANASYRATLADVAETIKQAQNGVEGFSTSLDANTVEGSKNRDMFANLAADSQDAAQKYLEQETATLGATEATERYSARLSEGREMLIEQITALTGNRDAAIEYADSIYGIPTEQELEFMSNQAEAMAKAQAYDEMLKNITPEVWTQMQLNTGPAQTALESFIEANDGRSLSFHAGVMGGSENGNLFTREFANGGIMPGTIPSGFYQGEKHKFAETNLPWEAYISPKPGQSARNEAIWVETGERLGIVGKIMQAIGSGGGGGSQSFVQDIKVSMYDRDPEIVAKKLGRGLRSVIQ